MLHHENAELQQHAGNSHEMEKMRLEFTVHETELQITIDNEK